MYPEITMVGLVNKKIRYFSTAPGHILSVCVKLGVK